MPRRPNRRDILKTSALAGVGYWVGGSAARAASKSPNEKLNLAKIACGGMGHSDLESFAKCGVNIVALCDVDDHALQAAKKLFPKAETFHDFREMFDKMHKDFDAVSVSTPDHTHAVATMMALKHGKHCYTQKPLTHDVYEARMLTEAAKKTGLVTQMGNQGTSHNGLRQAVEVIQSGAIGHVREVHVWTNRAGTWWPQGGNALTKIPAVVDALRGAEVRPTPVPEHLKWDLWLGTAPDRAYQELRGKGGNTNVYCPFVWRGWWDFGTGALGDMACHTANMAFMACKLGYPTSVEAEVSEYNSQTYPMWSVLRYEFPARGEMPPLKWTWYDGGRDRPAWVNKKIRELAGLKPDAKLADSGSLLIGDKGMLFSPNDYGSEYILLPEKDFEGYKPPEPRLPRFPGDKKDHPWHWQEFVTACQENKPEMCMSNFGYAGPLTETVVLGCVAIRAQKKIEWDGPNMKITNAPEANRYLKREYRSGWTL